MLHREEIVVMKNPCKSADLFPMHVTADITPLPLPLDKGRKGGVTMGILLSLILITLTAGCKSRESYKREIERKGMTYSTESFLNNAAVGDREIAELFLKAGMDINAKGNDRGETALMIAAVSHNIELMKVFIENGADINAKDNDGYTALMFASSQGNGEVTKFLIARGADVNAQNNNGETPLMLAVLHDDLEITEILIEKGADLRIRDDKGREAIDYAFLNKPIKELLRKAMMKK